MDDFQPRLHKAIGEEIEPVGELLRQDKQAKSRRMEEHPRTLNIPDAVVFFDKVNDLFRRKEAASML
jgi:hypothetical protein